jgi:hypothetical protein
MFLVSQNPEGVSAKPPARARFSPLDWAAGAETSPILFSLFLFLFQENFENL